MTTPNIELIMPKTALFTGKAGAAQWLTTQDGKDFVYLPKGTSMVQVVATGMYQVHIRTNVEINGKGRVSIGSETPVKTTQRIFTDTFANAREGNQGMWIRIWVGGLTEEQAAGTVGVTIIPLQAE